MRTELVFDDDIDDTRVEAVVQAIDAAPSAPLVIALGDADIPDGRACAAVASAIRRAAERLGDVTVIRPPQVLAHTLYRVGALGGGAIQLVEPRDELGTAG